MTDTELREHVEIVCEPIAAEGRFMDSALLLACEMRDRVLPETKRLRAEIKRLREWLRVAPHMPECARKSIVSRADACTCGLHALLAETTP